MLYGMSAGYLMILIFVMIWSGVWKAIALWKSARNSHLAWFIVLLLVNTVGLLEILYIYIFSKNNKKGKKKSKTKAGKIK
ncbi:hypothetical protein JW949_00775 [Candidatus Woesearchaeota archaeon]|nr:hypothetical protein [Candidatus Woesearchaeota archaeon]